MRECSAETKKWPLVTEVNNCSCPTSFKQTDEKKPANNNKCLCLFEVHALITCDCFSTLHMLSLSIFFFLSFWLSRSLVLLSLSCFRFLLTSSFASHSEVYEQRLSSFFLSFSLSISFSVHLSFFAPHLNYTWGRLPIAPWRSEVLIWNKSHKVNWWGDIFHSATHRPHGDVKKQKQMDTSCWNSGSLRWDGWWSDVKRGVH